MSDYAETFIESYGTALVADAAYRTGAPLGVAPSGLAPLDRTWKIAGPVVTVNANNDLVSILAATHRAAPGDVVLITNRTAAPSTPSTRSGRAGSGQAVGLLGDLIATEGQRKGLAGFIVDGLVRDSAELLEIGVPVLCRGTLPVGPLKLPAALKGIGEVGVEVALGDASVAPGDWGFGDADGVIFLAAEHLPAVFERAATSCAREEALAAEVRSGSALGDLLDVEAFLEKRDRDPDASFNEHLQQKGRAI